ncbi:MAG: hypothetical protein LAP13_15105 [Acidobacteriia bacterium]|nr:hypothetical protein [Terriglobia bacterium]
MKTQPAGRSVFWLSFPIAALVVVTSWAGLFWPSTYAQETLNWATQGRGGDVVNVALVVPVLVVSATLALRGSQPARLVWMGSLLYLLYNFIIYTLAVHFNALFLIYCGTLGLSFYALAGSLPSLPAEEIARSYGPGAPAKTVALVFLVLASLAAVGWLQEDIPALLSHQTPQNIKDLGLLTNPVHVLDLALLLPGLVVTAIMLLRRKVLGFVFAPALITFMMLMSAQLAALIVVMGLKGFGTEYGMAGLFAALAVGFAVLLARFFAGKDQSPQATSSDQYPNAA